MGGLQTANRSAETQRCDAGLFFPIEPPNPSFPSHPSTGTEIAYLESLNIYTGGDGGAGVFFHLTVQEDGEGRGGDGGPADDHVYCRSHRWGFGWM